MKALGEAATDLPWLCPCADSLLTLARSPSAAAWAKVRFDPACVLLLIRQGGSASLSPPALSPDWFHDPALLEGAQKLLTFRAFVDWEQPDAAPIYRTCVRQAQLAEALARNVPNCDLDCAWSAGLLAPLGWLAACAVDVEQASACLRQPRFPHEPSTVQQSAWGLEHTAIARRLSRRWRLPLWLATVVGHLGLPVAITRTLGADPALFQVVQLAVGLVQQHGEGLRLAVGTEPDELIAQLGLSQAQVELALVQLQQTDPPSTPHWQAPSALPWLPDLLHLAIENRRQVDPTLIERLQHDVDNLQRALEEQCAGEKERLQNLKLRALAEMAAGAGHEINNPLAVISGQAQHLAAHEGDPLRVKALQTIVNQAQRIHEILNELMQFARPSAPQRQRLDVHDLIRTVAGSLEGLAAQRRIRLVCPDPKATYQVEADPAQMEVALRALLRNAIEAAPPEGWASLRAEMLCGTLQLVVEDSGPGPQALAREHLFDPFYSGRSAGRGRGLGLPTAWRLVRQQGGDVRFDTNSHGPTRFILSLPAPVVAAVEINGDGHNTERNGIHARSSVQPGAASSMDG